MSKRKYPDDLKSLLHFDYPYWNEPNDGLVDEVSSETWINESAGWCGDVMPYTVKSSPKFGHRCAYFTGASSTIYCTNTSGIFTITPTDSYELECFVKQTEKEYPENVFNGHTYEYSLTGAANSLSWDNAQAACVARGGHLATITSAEEKDFLAQLKPHTAICWIGLKSEGSKNYQWVTGEPLDYQNWRSGYPKQTGRSAVYLEASGSTANQWTDKLIGTAKHPYLCEWDYVSLPLDGDAVQGNIITFSTKLNVGITKYGRLVLNGDIISAIEPFDIDTWHHVLLRISNGTAVLYADGDELSSVSIPELGITPTTQNPFKLGGFKGCIDEFAFRHSAGSSTITVPVKPYSAELTADDTKIYGTGEDGDAEITNDTQINSYGLITSTTDAKTFTVSSWSNGTCLPEAGREVVIHVSFTQSTTAHTEEDNPAELGLYVFRKITSIDGLTVTLDKEITASKDGFAIDSTLLSSCYVQIITIPNYNSLNITSTGIIRPLTFGASTGGGIVAFRCLGDCTVAGKILTHGTGSKRLDLYQMEHSKLIDRFICSRGGGMYITCGGTFTTTEDARLGASWSGLGDGTNGAAGCGGNAYLASGGVGGGAGGHGVNRSGDSSRVECKGGNVGENGESYASSTAYQGGGGGCNGEKATYNDSIYSAGGNGGGQGINTISPYGVNGQGCEDSANNDGCGGCGGGTAGGDGYETTAGASLILIADKASIEEASISTGGEGYTTYDDYRYRSGAGCGFCYMAIGELLSDETGETEEDTGNE